MLVLAGMGSALAACGGGTAGQTVAPLPETPPRSDTPLPETPPRSDAGTLTTTSVRNAVSGLAPLAFGQLFRPGDLPSGAVLAGLQLDVKNRWPDGSVCFGLVSGLVNLVADAPVALGLQAGGGPSGPVLSTDRLRTMALAASIDAGAFGQASWTDADWAAPFATWAAGPMMSSWKFRKPIGSDAQLVAWLELTLWSDGSVEVLPSVENASWMVPAPSNKTAIFVFTLGGRERFRRSIDLLHGQRAPLLSGSATSHWLGNAHDITLRHDSAYLQSTGMLPHYQAQTPAGAAALAALPRSFVPLQQGNWPNAMGSGGYSSSIGLLPEWDVLYLSSSAIEAFKGVVFNAYSAGRYNYHRRDETNAQMPHRPPLVSRYPALTLREPSPGWSTPPAASGPAPPPWSYSHQPSSGYLAYLLTGRLYFLEEVQLAAATNALASPYTWREGVKGIFKSQAAGAVRAVAWCLRTLAQAAAITPDGDTVMKAEFMANLRHNVEYYHGRYVARPSNPLGFITPYSDYNGLIAGRVATGSGSTEIIVQDGLYGPPYNETADDQYVGWRFSCNGETRTVSRFVMAQNRITVDPPFSSAPAAGAAWAINDSVYFEASWMQAFFTAAIGYARDLGHVLPAATQTRLRELFEWNSRSIVGQFGTAAENEFLFRDAMPYSIAIAPSETPDFDGGTGPWFSNFGQVYRATLTGRSPLGRKPPPYASPGPKTEGPLRMWLSPEGYLANGLPALAYAVRHGAAGAAVAYQRLTSASNWPEVKQGLDLEPVWAVAPGTPAVATMVPAGAAPAWNRGQAVGEWREVPGSAMYNLQPTQVALTLSGGAAVVGAGARMDAWCGLSVDTRSSRVWSVANGGHGDYYGNEVCTIDLLADVPTWVEWCPGSSGKVVDNVTPGGHASHARYTDGLPCSTHSYYGQQFIERHNRALRLGGSTSPLGSAFENVEAFDVAQRSTRGWDPAGTYGMCLGNANGGWTPAIGWCACKDPVTENIYVVNSPQVRRFVPSATGIGGTWSVLGTVPAALNTGALGATAVDTKRNRLLWLHGYGPNQPYTCDLANGEWTARQHPASTEKLAFDALSASLGMVYVQHQDAFLVRANAAGGRVYRIDAQTMAVSYLATAGGDRISRGAVLSGEDGVYNRWLYVPQLRGVVYFPLSASNAWFLQL